MISFVVEPITIEYPFDVPRAFENRRFRSRWGYFLPYYIQTRFWKPPFPAFPLILPGPRHWRSPREKPRSIGPQSPNYRLPTPGCVAGRRSEPTVSGPIIRTMRGSRSNQRVDGGDGGGGEDQSAFSTVLNRRGRRSEPAG